jgi:hypothetical protein
MNSVRRSTWVVLTAAVLAILLGVALAGCSSLTGAGDSTTLISSGSATTSMAPVTSSSGPAAMVTSTPSTVSASEHVTPDGRIKVMGYITKVWVSGGVRHLRIDYADMWSGAEAQAKFDEAKAAGREPADATLDGDWYITNIYHTTYEYVVSNSVDITTATRWAPHDGMEAPCSWGDFISFWGPGPFADGDTGLSDFPWWIWREGDTVTQIAQQYLE